MNDNEATPMYVKVVQRARDGVASPRQAIKAFCLTCVGFARSDITGCTAKHCPLHAYRPYQDSGDE